jgi:NAD(P)-dependent dehydrogenase (short-subunit alcohol dehydrogenase family)
MLLLYNISFKKTDKKNIETTQGRATVIEMVNEGYNVYACDVNEDGLKDTIQGLPSSKVAMQLVNVSKEEQVKSAVDNCVKKFGSIHVMFANAGVGGDYAGFHEYSEDNMEQVFKVNVYGVFYSFKHAFLAMQKLGVTDGSLIGTASVAGIRSGAGGAAYSASKAAVISIGQTVANQLTGTGIRCNIVCPGLIETGMTKPIFEIADSRNNRSKIGQLNPMLRYGVAKEIATVVIFLASPAASYVNGQAIAVDGGLSSSHPIAFRKPGKISM